MLVPRLSIVSMLLLVALCLYQSATGLCNVRLKNFLKFAQENPQVKGFTDKEPEMTPAAVVKFIDRFPFKTFTLFDEICMLPGQKSFTSGGERRQITLEETIVRALSRKSLFTALVTSQANKISLRTFETFWKKEITRPCHKIIKTHDWYLDDLPSFYNIGELYNTRIGALFRFEEMCRKILKQTSPQAVHKELLRQIAED